MNEEQAPGLSRITTEPGKRSGQPCIRDTRIAVKDVLGYLAAGMTVEEILSDFPQLDREDVAACVVWGKEMDF